MDKNTEERRVLIMHYRNVNVGGMERQESVIFVERYEDWENGDGVRRSPGEFPSEPVAERSETMETAETAGTPKAIRDSSFAMAVYDAAKICCGKKIAKKVAFASLAAVGIACFVFSAYALLRSGRS